jgi:drug/metabolite transporter (DMT)-like permease
MISMTVLLWGVLAIFLKFSLRTISVHTIIWFRFFFSFLFLVVYYAIRSPHSFAILKAPPVLGILAGIGLSANYYGFTVGLDLTSPSNVQILIQLSPMMVAVIGVVFFKEPLTRIQKVGFLVAMAGFVLFYRDQLSNLIVTRDAYLEGNLWVVFAAVAWAGYAVCQKLLLRHWTPLQTNLLIYLVSSLVFFPKADFGELMVVGWIDWLVLLFMGANTLIAYGALAEALKVLPANQVSAIIVLNPLITLAVAAVLSKMNVSWMAPENITLMGYVGSLLLLAGVCLVVKKGK